MATIFKQYQNQYFKKHPPKDPKEVQKKLEELKKKQIESQQPIEKNSASTVSSTGQQEKPQMVAESALKIEEPKKMAAESKQDVPKEQGSQELTMNIENTSNSNSVQQPQKPVLDPKYKNIRYGVCKSVPTMEE